MLIGFHTYGRYVCNTLYGAADGFMSRLTAGDHHRRVERMNGHTYWPPTEPLGNQTPLTSIDRRNRRNNRFTANIISSTKKVEDENSPQKAQPMNYLAEITTLHDRLAYYAAGR